MELLRTLRESKGYSLSVLARETCLSPSFLRDLEKGTRKASVESLLRLAKVLGSKSELFFASKKLEPQMEEVLFEEDFYRFLNRFSHLESEAKEDLLIEFAQIINATDLMNTSV